MNELRDSDDSATRARARTLDGQFAHGIAWTGAARAASQIVSWASFLAVARILSPGDFGIVAGATSVVGLVALMSEFGLGTAIVAKSALEPGEIRQLAGMAAGLGVAAWLICAIVGWPAAAALRIPQLVRVLPVVGLSIALTTCNAVPIALLRRQLAFRTLSLFEMIKAFLAAGTVLGAALAGAGFWAPLLGDLVASAAMAAMLFRSSGLVPQRPRWHAIADSMRLSREVLVSRAAWYMYSNADFAVVSRRLGAGALGDYSMAWTLINLPTEKVATLIFSVTPGIFARVRDDLAEFRRYVLLLVESLAMLLMPMSAGIGLVATDAVAVVLGERWRHAAPLIQALALFAVVKSIAPLSAQILISRGHAAAARRQSLWGLAILPLAFVLASRYGAVAVALVWTSVYPVMVAFQLREAAHEIGLPIRSIARRIAPILLGTAVMSAAVLLLQRALAGGQLRPAVHLSLSIAVGAVVYTLVLWVVARERLRSAYTFVRQRQ